MKKALVLEVDHDDDDVEILGLAVGKYAIIYSKEEVPCDPSPFSNKTVKVMMRNVGYLPRTWLGKRLGIVTPLPKVHP